MEAKCAVCGETGLIGSGFEMRGKYDGYIVLKCNSCSSGLL